MSGPGNLTWPITAIVCASIISGGLYSWNPPGRP